MNILTQIFLEVGSPRDQLQFHQQKNPKENGLDISPAEKFYQKIISLNI